MHVAVSKWSVLIVAIISSFLTPFISSSINIALPSIDNEFVIDAVLLSWVATSYLLATAVFLVPFGRVADMHGRKRIFSFGIVVLTISSFLSAVSTSSTMLILFRFLQGIGGAMISSTGTAILISVFSVEERGKVLGINAAAIYTGLSLGPFLGGSLTQYFGWRSIFLANVLIGLAALVLVLSKLKGEWVDAKGEKFDYFGSIVYGLALVAIMYGLSLLPEMRGGLLILLGVFGIVVFVRWETKAKSPVLDMSLFRNNTVFAFSNLTAFINYSATFAVIFLLSLYLQFITGLSPQNAGLIIVSQPVMMAVFSPIAGRLSDRIEPRIVSSVGMALNTFGLFLLTFLDNNTSLSFIIGTLVIIGLGLAFFSSPNTNAVMTSVEKRSYSLASGTLGTMRMVGMMVSMGIAMLIFATYIGRIQITPLVYPLFLMGVKSAFIIYAALCFAGIFTSLVRGKIR